MRKTPLALFLSSASELPRAARIAAARRAGFSEAISSMHCPTAAQFLDYFRERVQQGTYVKYSADNGVAAAECSAADGRLNIS